MSDEQEIRHGARFGQARWCSIHNDAHLSYVVRGCFSPAANADARNTMRELRDVISASVTRQRATARARSLRERGVVVHEIGKDDIVALADVLYREP